MSCCHDFLFTPNKTFQDIAKLLGMALPVFCAQRPNLRIAPTKNYDHEVAPTRIQHLRRTDSSPDRPALHICLPV
jgi:hypothetical protein